LTLRGARCDPVDRHVGEKLEEADRSSSAYSLMRRETSQRNGTSTLLERPVCEFGRWEI
jgi:hypothetical protein